MPIRQLARLENINPTLLLSLVRRREIDSVIIGDRLRYVVLARSRDYLERAAQ